MIPKNWIVNVYRYIPLHTNLPFHFVCKVVYYTYCINFFVPLDNFYNKYITVYICDFFEYPVSGKPKILALLKTKIIQNKQMNKLKIELTTWDEKITFYRKILSGFLSLCENFLSKHINKWDIKIWLHRIKI